MWLQVQVPHKHAMFHRSDLMVDSAAFRGLLIRRYPTLYMQGYIAADRDVLAGLPQPSSGREAIR
jgi:hypothetical protein